jgi:hypothetical protein
MNRGREQEAVGRNYRLLGVKEGAPMESVRRGYHRMSKDHQYVFLNTLCSLWRCVLLGLLCVLPGVRRLGCIRKGRETA